MQVLAVAVGLSPLLTDFPLPLALAVVAGAFGMTAISLWSVPGRGRGTLVTAVLATAFAIAAFAALHLASGGEHSRGGDGEVSARLVRHELLVSDVALRAAAHSSFPGLVLPLTSEEWALHREALAALMAVDDWERVALYYDLVDAVNGNPAVFVDHGPRMVADLRRQLKPALVTLESYVGQ